MVKKSNNRINIKLSQKYDVRNWETFGELLKDFYGFDDEVLKCYFCIFNMPGKDDFVCSATYYGNKIKNLTKKEVDNCEEWEIIFTDFISLGESNEYPEFTDYINKN